MAKVLINETSLSGIADAIRAKNGSSETYKPSEMAAAIEAIEAGGGGEGLPEEALTITGNCYYRFGYNGWNWLIDNYGDKVTTSDITDCQYMFKNSSNLKEIPFEINCSAIASYIGVTEIFNNCNNLRSISKIYAKVGNLDKMFYNCYRLRELPEDFADSFDWSYSDGLTSSVSGKRSAQFYSCYSLRKIPMSFLEHGNPVVSYSNSIYNTMCQRCHSLDEIVDLPNPHLSATWTSNAFSYTVTTCSRLKNLTFKTPNGVPYVVKWKSQTIDLSSNVGYASTSDVSYITNYNSGITTDKRVTDDATYAALKNDPDWFTTDIAYSRYNHDSAVATINSLPDASAYLATTSGTNTIKFKGASGSKTDGGAINTLTDAEIAVAAAKGWTVTLV
jgi:hypothetical protein